MDKNTIMNRILGTILIIMGLVLTISVVLLAMSSDIYGRILMTFLGFAVIILGFGVISDTKSGISKTLTNIGIWTIMCIVLLMGAMINLSGVGLYISAGFITILWFLLISIGIRYRDKK
jgi:hypothetical protein